MHSTLFFLLIICNNVLLIHKAYLLVMNAYRGTNVEHKVVCLDGQMGD